jgi:hypothetical protein
MSLLIREKVLSHYFDLDLGSNHWKITIVMFNINLLLCCCECKYLHKHYFNLIYDVIFELRLYLWRFFDLMLVKLFPSQTFWMTFCLFGWDKIKISKCSWWSCCWWFNGDWIPALFSTLLQFPPLNYHGYCCHILLIT